jgi:MoaA/NifB/PqqE/SkfB family radical SAM enzyme
MSLDTVKKVAAEFALDKAIKYVTKNPEKNLFTILDFLEKIATMPEHKNMMRVVKEHFKRNPEVMEQTKRVAGNPKMLFNLVNSWGVNGTFLGKPKREKLGRELGVSVPSLILVDPTSACNLRCEGCWAGEYNKADHLEPELFDRIITEAKELGIHWIVLSGGEPFCYPHLFDVIADHPDSVFMVYTNGTLIDEKAADRLAELANLSPSISLEGWREQTDARRGAGVFDKVIRAMDLLRERGVIFGTSVTAMRTNTEQLFSDEFIDFLIEKGVIYMWCFHYIPIGRNPNVEMMLTTDQRLGLVQRIRELRQNKPLLIADFWNDGDITGGCIAGGRTYFHINAAADVEPCAFVHFAADNIRDKSLREVLQNPFFKAYQREQPFNNNHLAPCPIIDAPEALRNMVRECHASPTHQGAGQVLEGEVAKHLDRLSREWLDKANAFKAGSVESAKREEVKIGQ